MQSTTNVESRMVYIGASEPAIVDPGVVKGSSLTLPPTFRS